MRSGKKRSSSPSRISGKGCSLGTVGSDCLEVELLLRLCVLGEGIQFSSSFGLPLVPLGSVPVDGHSELSGDKRSQAKRIVSVLTEETSAG